MSVKQGLQAGGSRGRKRFSYFREKLERTEFLSSLAFRDLSLGGRSKCLLVIACRGLLSLFISHSATAFKLYRRVCLFKVCSGFRKVFILLHTTESGYPNTRFSSLSNTSGEVDRCSVKFWSWL